MLEMLDCTIRIGSTLTFLYFFSKYSLLSERSQRDVGYESDSHLQERLLFIFQQSRFPLSRSGKISY